MDQSQISLGTAALVIFVICVGFVFLRGVVRMLFGTLLLGGSLLVGFVVWQKAPGWMVALMGKPVEWVPVALAVVAFLGTFLISRGVVGFFLRPFKGAGEGARTPVGIGFRLALALVPTGFLWLVGATLVHHFGSIAEVERAADGKAAGQGWGERFRELRKAVAGIVPEDWLRRLDPLADPDHLSLAKWIAAQSGKKGETLIDPETGKPYPRAVIVEEPELTNLVQDGRFGTLLRHPLLEKALKDPGVREAVRRNIEHRTSNIER